MPFHKLAMQFEPQMAKEKSRRTANVLSCAYSYTAAFEKSKSPVFLSNRDKGFSPIDTAAKWRCVV